MPVSHDYSVLDSIVQIAKRNVENQYLENAHLAKELHCLVRSRLSVCD
jgi:hypothetical protein